MSSLEHPSRTFLFYMVLGLIAIAVCTSVVLYFPYSGNKEEIHPTGHGLIRESDAVHFPLEITQFYKDFDIEKDDGSKATNLKIYQNVIDTERNCEFCIAFVYTPDEVSKTEVSFSSHVKGYDLSGAKKVTFFVMGDKGDEVVTLKAAGKKKITNGIEEKSKDFAASTKPIKLEKQWKKLEIDLSTGDLNDVTYPFALQFKEGKKDVPVVVYVKWIMYQSDAATNPLPVETALPNDNGGIE
ncbi:MAG TPA: hypothetical protein VLD38_07200 [Nitrosopumilaceae archaeon]|nr:hypothetical protein [Nitrosopumilaceae archaeon]